MSFFTKTAKNLRQFSSTSLQNKKCNQPANTLIHPRPSGIASFMRLPVVDNNQDLDVAFVGVPLDGGTSNRSGTRMGPRGIRCESVLKPYVNQWTGAQPFNHVNCADLGDVSLTMYNLPKACDEITQFYDDKVLKGAAKHKTMPIMKI